MFDPRTKRSTAFYAALGVMIWDVKTKGLNLFNLAGLLALAGVAGFDTLLTSLKAKG